MAYKSNINPDLRTFYLSAAGNDNASGNSIEVSKATIAACITAVNALSPPSSTTNPSAIVAAGSGAFIETGLIFPDGCQLNVPNVAMISTGAAGYTPGDFSTHEFTLARTSTAAAAVYLLNNINNFVMRGQTIVSGGAASIGIHLTGTSDIVVIQLATLIMTGVGAIGIKDVNDNTIPEVYDIEYIGLEANNTIAFEHNPPGGNSDCLLNIGSIDSVGVLTGTKGLWVRAGEVECNALHIDAVDAITVENGAVLNLQCTSLHGNIIVNAGGTLNCDINQHVSGSITNNGTIIGYIDGTEFGDFTIKDDLIIEGDYKSDSTRNTRAGTGALLDHTNADDCVAIGFDAMRTATGTNNIGIGLDALKQVSGNNNICIGTRAGDTLTTGGGNILLGDQVETPTATTTNHAILGATSISTTILRGNVGIGVDAPQQKLHLQGDVDGSVRALIENKNTGSSAQASFELTQGTNTFVYFVLGDDSFKIFTKTGGRIIYRHEANGSLSINTANAPDLTSVLDLVSTTKGLLVPRLTTTQRDAITSPATGLILYNTTLNTLQEFNGTIWRGFDNPLLSDAARNTFGGTNALNSIASGADNTAFGFDALTTSTSGNTSVAIGSEALKLATGDANTAIGFRALGSTSTGISNTAVGFAALFGNIGGNNNTALGNGSLFANTSGNNNIAVGNASLIANTTGNNSIGIGANTLQASISGSGNIAIGFEALLTETTGSNNTAIGLNALRVTDGGSNNTAIGAQALSLATGGENTAIGFQALKGASAVSAVGSFNVAIGFNCLKEHTNGADNVAIGHSAMEFNTGTRNIGIGKNTLDVGTGADNVAIGRNASGSSMTANQNVAVGNLALSTNMTGNNNTAIGHQAMGNMTAALNGVAIGLNAMLNAVGSNNVAVGYLSMENADTSNSVAIGRNAMKENAGNNSVAVGIDALLVATGAADTIAIGSGSLIAVTLGDNNTAVGDGTGATLTTGNNNVLIGRLADVSSASASNEIVLGNSSNTSTLLRGTVTGDRYIETDSLNVVKVYDAAGLPDTLVAGTNYILQSPITVSTTKTFPVGGSVQISTTNVFANVLTYSGTGTLFAGTTVGFVLLDLQIESSSTGTMFGITGAGTPAVFVHRAGGFANWDNIGTLTSFGLVVQNNLLIDNFDSGLSLVSCDGYISDQCNWFNSSDQSIDFITFDANIMEINVLNVAYSPFANERVFNINSSADVHAFITLVQRVASADRYFNSSGKDKTSPGIIVTASANIENSGTNAELFMLGNTAATSIPLAGAMVEINLNVNWTSADVERLSVGVDGAVESLGLRPAKIKIDANINLEPSTASKSISIRTVLVMLPSIVITFTNATNTINEPATNLTNGDTISFRDSVGTLPAELRTDVVYFVVNQLANSFQISYTSGGAVVAFTDNGSGAHTYEVATLHGSTPTSVISAAAPEDLIPQATIPATLNSNSFMIVINNDDAVDITVNNGYQRYFV